jgi:hypothetical protein
MRTIYLHLYPVKIAFPGNFSVEKSPYLNFHLRKVSSILEKPRPPGESDMVILVFFWVIFGEYLGDILIPRPSLGVWDGGSSQRTDLDIFYGYVLCFI